MGLVVPLLPPPRLRPQGGRPPVDDRKALAGILFVLHSGIPLHGHLAAPAARIG